MSLPDWEEELVAGKTLLSINRKNLKRRTVSRPSSVGVPDGRPYSVDSSDDIREPPSLKGDRLNMALLLFLYILQGMFVEYSISLWL